MTLNQFINKYCNYIDNLKFKDLHKQLVKSIDIFRLDDNLIEELNKLLLEEVGIDLLYEADKDPNYVIITNRYCQDLCKTNSSPFVYNYTNKLNTRKSASAIFNDLIDSNIHNLFDYIIDSSSDQINLNDARSIFKDESRVKYLELSIDYSGGIFQIILDFCAYIYEDFDNVTDNISFVINLDNSFGYGFSKSYWDSHNNKYAINTTAIDTLIKNINKQILEALEK